MSQPSMAAMQDLQRRVQVGVENLVNSVEKSFLRSKQREAFLCAANCCTRTEDSSMLVQNCVDNCQQPALNAQVILVFSKNLYTLKDWASFAYHFQKFLQNEIEDLQNRFQRGVSQCQDKVKDRYGAMDNFDQIAASRDMEQCVLQVGNELLNGLPKVEQRIQKHMKNL